MDPEQTFIRVQERFSQIVTPKVRAALEYIYLFIAITLFCILVVMHANYVQQISSAGLWSQNESEFTNVINDVPEKKFVMDKLEFSNVDGDGLTSYAAKFWLNWIGSSARRGKLKSDTEIMDHQVESSMLSVDDAVMKTEVEESRSSFPLSAKETVKAALFRFTNKWHRRLSFLWKHATNIIGSLWNIAGIHLDLDIPKWLHILRLDRLNSYAVQWLENRSKTFEPTYLYTMEKGYFLLPESARAQHNIHTVNISISARHSCFGNRWQQLLINRFVGYDTILINSLLSSPGQGYLYNFQTKEFFNLSYAHEPPEGPARFGDYLVTKCGVLMMSLFVFFTTTMSVSFTLRETQTRMLKFTVQLQHHARHQLPTFQLIFVHVIESLVFVPIMIGILFFLFEFYDDQLLAFMVLILVWLSELFTLISVRTRSMKFFPRFFLLYFLVFHIYFFSYAYGFSYLALSTAAAFMQHLILYFWNRFEPCLAARILHHISKQRTVVLSIHQPSYRILHHISNFLILSHGSVVHNGSIELLEETIGNLGMQIPLQLNALEFAMEVIKTLEDSYSRSTSDHHSVATENKEPHSYPSLSEIEHDQTNDMGNYFSSLYEIMFLCSRFWKIIYRTKQLLLARTLQALVGGFGLASVYMKIRNDEGGVAERLGLFAFSLSFLLSSTVEALPIYLQERRVLMKEASRGAYKVSSYMIANTIVFLPFLFAVAILFAVPVYWLVGLNPSAAAFAFFTFVVWLIVLMASSLVLFLSAVSPDFISGNSLICTVLGAFFLFSGYFIPKESIPKYWLFMYYVSIYRYPLDTLLTNEYWSTRSKCFSWHQFPSQCLLTGNDVLRSRGLDKDTRWINVGIMFGFFVFYRVLCWVILCRRASKTTL